MGMKQGVNALSKALRYGSMILGVICAIIGVASGSLTSFAISEAVVAVILVTGLTAAWILDKFAE